MRLAVDLGVFAHNEAARIAAMVGELGRQDFLGHPEIDARIVILANGCTDATVARARAAIEAAHASIEIAELPQGGKSRTWNRFVHDLSRPEATVLMFADADIELPVPGMLSRLALGLAARPELSTLNSQPVKDIVHRPEGLSALDRLIAAGGGTLDDWKTAICGQLYAMPAAVARRFHLPIGLPVEDGFLRAMVLTDALTGEEDFSRIDGLDDVFHVYPSERGLLGLIRHQTRIVIGSAINTATFAHLHDVPVGERHDELARAAASEDWLSAVLRARLPRAPFGYVPFHFLTKRLVRTARAPRGIKRRLVTVAGFGLDAIVYVLAQARMANGTGVGYW
jgi:hypothetical protein